MIRRIIDWLDSRTGIETAIRSFLYEEIPASAGWHNVLGSVALFCFLLQVFTGILLSFNYAPTPGDAFNSVRYIVTELTGGRLIRGLHHWGASLMIVVVVLHMAQVFLWGGYKKPREATWLMGLLLLQLVLAFGLTGYLLPWDNRAYWGTVVTTQIASKAPVAGPYLLRLLGSEDGGIGVVTFARFYSLHVMLLPLVTLIAIGIHVYLVRKHGVAPLAGDTAPKKKFHPGQVFKDTVAIFVAFVILLTLAVAAQAPLGQLADPTDTAYIPRPEWYFLFLFQTLKFFEGPLEIVGSMVLPGLAMLALSLLPFFDRGEVRRVTKRTTAIGAFVLGAITWTGLTVGAVVTAPKEVFTQNLVQPVQEWANLSPEELAGLGLFRRENCYACHLMGSRGKPIGPDVTRVAGKRDAAWLILHFKRPQELVPGSSMPPIQLGDAQLNALAAFLLKLKPANALVLETAPAHIVEGAIIYQQFRCGACHQVNHVGIKLGPVLNGLGQRRTREWIVQHFIDPQKLSPGTVMPPYRFSARDMDRITAYLLAIPPRPPALEGNE